MLRSLPFYEQERNDRLRDSTPGFCEEKHRLLREFVQTIHDLNTVQSQQMQAVVAGDPDFSRFDLLLHIAQERKDAAKYAWIAHVENHNCQEA